MKPVTAPGAAVRTPLRGPADATWNERAGRLFEEFERPAKAMVRRAFRGAFGPDELDDIYAGAWVGTLRALSTPFVMTSTWTGALSSPRTASGSSRLMKVGMVASAG